MDWSEDYEDSNEEEIEHYSDDGEDLYNYGASWNSEGSDSLESEEYDLENLVRIRIKSIDETVKPSDYIEPHWNEIIEATNEIAYFMDAEKEMAVLKYCYKYDQKRISRGPKRNELITMMEKLLDFMERLAMHRGKHLAPAISLRNAWKEMERKIFSVIDTPWKEKGIIVDPYPVLGFDKTAYKAVVRKKGQVLARIKAHFGPDNWPAEAKQNSSLPKTSSSSNVIANGTSGSEHTAADLENGIVAALSTNFFSANRSPQIPRTPFDSPQTASVSTVREIASNSEEHARNISPNGSPRARNNAALSVSPSGAPQPLRPRPHTVTSKPTNGEKPTMLENDKK